MGSQQLPGAVGQWGTSCLLPTHHRTDPDTSLLLPGQQNLGEPEAKGPPWSQA